MGKRPSKPTKLKVLEGNRGRRDLSNEPESPELTKKTKPPDYLDDIAKEKWKYYLDKFDKTGIITQLDYDAFAFLCHIISSIINLTKRISRNGYMQSIERTNDEGEKYYERKESADSSALRQYYGHFRMYAKEFGLTPVGRVGLKINKGREKEDRL